MNRIDEVDLMKKFWERPEFNVPKFHGLKLEFEDYYRVVKKYEELCATHPEIRKSNVDELHKFGIGEDFFRYSKISEDFYLVLLQVIIDKGPLTAGSIFTNSLLNQIEEFEINSSFEQPIDLQTPISISDPKADKLFLDYFRNKKKPFVEKLKKILLTKKKYYDDLNLQSTYKKDDYNLVNRLHKGNLIQEVSNNKTKTKNISWKELFIDPNQTEIIAIKYLTEYTDINGKWTANGRLAVAFCWTLEKQGYLKKTLTNPDIAKAFNKNFGTTYTSKLFQPEEQNKSEGHREYFKNIPPFKIN